MGAPSSFDVVMANSVITPLQFNSTGKTLFVSNSSVLIDGQAAVGADSAGRGVAPIEPFSTIDYAIGQAVPNRCDQILVGQKHAETVSTSGGITLDVAGVSLIGLGIGALKPTLTFSATGANIAISANNTKFKNFKLVPSIDSVTSALVVTGDDVDIECDVQDATDLIEFVRAVTATGVNRGKIKLNYIGRTGGDACVNAIRLIGCTDLEIELYAYGKASTSWVEFHTTACTNIKINGVMYNSGTTNGSKNVIDTVTGSTWSATLFDATAGASQSGGSGSPLAFDDVSTIASDVTTIKGNVGGVDSATNILGSDNANNAFSSLNVVPNPDGSIIERVEYISQLVDGTNGIPTYFAAARAANGISVSEVLRHIQNLVSIESLNKDADNYIAVTADFTSATWNTVASHELFTVTGAVRMRVIAECTATLTDAANLATISLGVEGATNAWIAATGAAGNGGTTIDSGELWIDATPAETNGNTTSVALDKVVAGGLDVGYEIGGEAMTGGTIVFHCWWSPISSTGNVVAGAGGSL